jgi:predicted TIM-barrel fold metal-dependent hydrolase
MNMPALAFDAHTHIFPDAIGPRVVAQLAATLPLPTSYNGTRDGLLRKLAEAGIAGSLNAPVATRADQVDAINIWAAEQNRWPILSLGAMHPDYPDIPTELRRVKDRGLPGIKLHPEYQGFAPDEPRLDIIWRTCRELGLIILLHAGNDWQFPPPCRANPAAIARVVRAWPGLTLIAAHFGGFEQWEAVAHELVGLPLYLDTSFAVGFLPDDQFVRLVRQHSSARVLFGSDAPWQDPPATLAAFRRLPFTPPEQHAILWANAARLFHLEEHACPATSAARKEPSCM